MNAFRLLALMPLMAACASMPTPNPGRGATVTLTEQTALALIYLVTWSEPNGRDTQATVVLPKDTRPGPGMVYFHLYGPGGSMTQFQDEAVEAASRGVRSVLIDGEVPWMDRFEGDAGDRDRIEKQMAHVRRAVELLVSVPGVDPARLGYVGHDYGAMYGALLSGETTPVSRFVLITPAPRWETWIIYFQRYRDKLTGYPALMKDLDPLTKVAARPEVARLIQFSRSDQYVTREDRDAWSSLPTAAKIAVFDSAHERAAVDGKTERLQWLYEPWGLLPPGHDLIDTVPVKGPQGTILVGKTEVTQAQWMRVMTTGHPWFPGPERPIEMVKWTWAVEFCNKLSALEGLPNAYQLAKDEWEPIAGSTGWRLPTVAEWEAAARGTSSKGDLPGTAALIDLAWTWTNAAGETKPVGTRQPNSLGLYDMSGNVREWCQDRGEDPASRLVKGGGVISDDKWAKISATEDLLETYSNNDLGFRVVRSLK